MACVLVVEDNDDLRALYKRALVGEGHSPDLVANGQEALDHLASSSLLPQLIILDLMMPVMDGWMFLQQKNKDARISDIPVVVCSASKESIPETILFLRKPIDLDRLLDVVDQYCQVSG